MMSFLKRYYHLIIMGIIVLFYMAQMGLFLANEQGTESEYLQSTQESMERLLSLSIKNKKNAVDMLTEVYIQSTLDQVCLNYPHGISLEEVLKEVEEEIVSPVSALKRFGIDQVEFYNLQGKSLLLIHESHDLIYNLDYSNELVQIALATQSPQNGYVHGMMSCGYRYVYPLFDQGHLMGVVEYTYEPGKIIEPVLNTMKLESIVLLENKDGHLQATEEGEERFAYFDEASGYAYEKAFYNLESMQQTLKMDPSSYQGLKEELSSLLIDGQEQILPIESKDHSGWIYLTSLSQAYDGYESVIVFYTLDRVLTNMKIEQRTYINYILIFNVGIALLLMLVFIQYTEKRKHAIKDNLTNLYTRYGFSSLGPNKRDTRAVILIDIDDFKKVNDDYGHQVGDQVLKSLGQLINHHIRKHDMAIRWGGEEFLILLDGVSIENCREKAKELQRALKKERPAGLDITMSIGIAPLEENYDQAFKLADLAMYEAKKNGKDQIVVKRR